MCGNVVDGTESFIITKRSISISQVEINEIVTEMAMNITVSTRIFLAGLTTLVVNDLDIFRMQYRLLHIPVELRPDGAVIVYR